MVVKQHDAVALVLQSCESVSRGSEPIELPLPRSSDMAVLAPIRKAWAGEGGGTQGGREAGREEWKQGPTAAWHALPAHPLKLPSWRQTVQEKQAFFLVFKKSFFEWLFLSDSLTLFE